MAERQLIHARIVQTCWTSDGERLHTCADDALDPWTPADPLGEALHFLRMSGAFYCRSELTAPWGLTLPPMPGYLWFHVVTLGEVLLETEQTPSRPCSDRATSRSCRTARDTVCAASPVRPRPGSSTSSASRSATATRSSGTVAAARRRG